MAEKLSLAGQIYGRWTVLEDYEVTPKGERKWRCRCTCGKERYVLERSLKSGNSTSCGCLRRERITEALSPDLTGQKFGELTVISRAEECPTYSGVPAGNGTRWICQCSCGERYEVLGTLLTTGRRTRCSGRAHQKNYAYTDITSQRFGRLTAMYPSRRNDRSGNVIWHCRCDCDQTSLLYIEVVCCP